MKRWAAVPLVFVISEMLGSFGVWHGTPTDWRGMPLRFWHYEFWRLAYWIPMALGACVVVSTFWYFVPSLRRYSVMLPVVLASALSIEGITSVVYWHALSVEQASFVGWSNEFNYVRDHLECWAIGLLISTGAWLFWMRRNRTEEPIQVH